VSSSSDRQLYALVGEGRAYGHATVPDGQTCQLLLFQMAMSAEDARRSIAGMLWAGGWSRWTIESGAPVDETAPPSDDQAVIEAMALARRDGSSIVIYPPELN
jgi:hypothetical protein